MQPSTTSVPDLAQIFEPVRDQLARVEQEFAQYLQSRVELIPQMGKYVQMSGGKRRTVGVRAAQIPEGTSLRDLGEYHLRGLGQPEHILQLVATDLPTDFPPLKFLAERSGNLPASLTPLIGRQRSSVCWFAGGTYASSRVPMSVPGGTISSKRARTSTARGALAPEPVDILVCGLRAVVLAGTCSPVRRRDSFTAGVPVRQPVSR